MTTDISRTPEPSIVLIGLMGAGKSIVGRRLAPKVGLAFTDADDEIAKAANCSISDIFEDYGEEAFRDLEKRVIARLLSEGQKVLSTGGGAFMDSETRALIAETSISIWLRADLDVLVKRTAKRGGRPLLDTGNPRETLAKLIKVRYPVYGEADIVIDTGDEPTESTVEKVIEALPAALRNGLENTKS